MIDYPAGIQFEWYAVDRAGHLGCFNTFGAGPVPAILLSRLEEGVCRHMKNAVESLPRSARVAHTRKSDDEFDDIATTGLFAFDFQSPYDPREVYGLLAWPRKPPTIDMLPLSAEMKELFSLVTFSSVDFGRRLMDPRSLIFCVEG